MKLDIQCLEPMVTDATIVGIDWYDGKYGYMHALCPSLAICYENGRMQLMCNENDPNPVLIDSGMIASSCSWNHNGSLIAVSGRLVEDDRQCNVVQFYSPLGDVISIKLIIFLCKYLIIYFYLAFTYVKSPWSLYIMLCMGRRILACRFSC